MRLAINGRNIDITQALKDYVEEKIGRITKHYDHIINIEVTLGVTKNRSVHDNHFAEATVFLNGAKIHVHEVAESMYACIDIIADKLDRQVKKHKDKMLKSKTGAGSIRTESIDLAEETEPTPEEDIVDINIDDREE